METVLILYNDFHCDDQSWQQSRAGVMDQVNAVDRAMNTLGVQHPILPVKNLKHLAQLLSERPERLIFNLIEEFTDSIQQACFVPALCEAFGKSCTGNNSSALLLAQNKNHAKAVLAASSLPVPAGTIVPPGRTLKQDVLPKGLYIIKPALSDASEGITTDSVINLPAEQKKASALIESLHIQFNQPVIIEQYIPSRELNVSVLEQNGSIKILPVAEIDFSAFKKNQLRIVDYDAKWRQDSFAYNNTPRKIPADLPSEIYQSIENLAMNAWHAIDCQDYIRVDFRLDEKKRPFIIEINPNPDISPDAGFAAALDAAEIEYKQFVSGVVQNAKRRFDTCRQNLCDSENQK